MFTTAPQTMKQVYEEISQQGANPWIALGNFMNSWYNYHKSRRRMLIKEPPALPEQPTLEQLQWATFCAASVEYFCQKYAIPCPKWVHDPRYTTLPEPWFFSGYAHLEQVREELKEESPEPFKQRNIFVSKRIYANKYEIAEDLRGRRSA
jgi:hypothetical protein